MPKPPPFPQPNGPISSVLDDLTLARLPAYLADLERDALRDPGKDVVQAALCAGQLVRAGELNRAGRVSFERWVASLDQETIGVLGEVGEQILTEASEAVGAFLEETPEAQALLDAAQPPVDFEPGEAPSEEPPRASAVTPDWLPTCIERRDQVESLIVVLGKTALCNEDEGTSEAATQAEQRLRLLAGSLDETLRSLMPLLGDHLGEKILHNPWLKQAALLQMDLPWLALLAPRFRSRPSGVVPALSRPRSSARVLSLRLPKKAPETKLALAAHGQDAPPIAAKDAQRLAVGPLRIELSRPENPDSHGEFTLSLALEDACQLDLSGDAVRVLDAQGLPLEPVAQGKRPRRWWGHFRGEGRFTLVVEGVAEDIPDIVIDRES